MYELVRSSAGFKIVGEGDAAPHSKIITPASKSLERTTAPIGPARVDRRAWRNFVTSGRADLSGLDQPIIDSWYRCRELGVDPAMGKCRDILDRREWGSESLQLRELISETRGALLDLIRDRGLLITISDRRGYLLGMFGDYRTLLSADKLNFGPGANWSEMSVGTNAIGTALAAGHAITVSGLEHFCEDHQSWICSAAPIFDLYGRMLGCIDISGPVTANHHMALTLAMKGARIMESRLLKRQAVELQQQSTGLVASAFNVVGTGLMVLDPDGVIKIANPAAADLLERKQDQLAGRSAGVYFEMKGALKHLAGAPGAHAAEGIGLKWKKRALADARLYPISTPNSALSGLLLVLDESVRRRSLSLPSQTTRADDPFNGVIGDSGALQNAVATARRVAKTAVTVLIAGDSGTGKEVMAGAIHKAGPRAKGPFVAVNCGAIPRDLIQSELFGYAPGAFTGAGKGGNPGKFEQASGGTLFLDEIAEMPLHLQVNLLRVLEEGHVTRVGGKHPTPVDVRIIAATNKDLKALVARKKFRKDLYYRLNVVTITLPPLCRRGGDIDLLATYFIDRMSEKLNIPVTRIDASFYRCLHRHDWPGNVRELKHAIEGAIVLMPGGVLSGECLSEEIRGKGRAISPVACPETLNLAAMEKMTIRQAHDRFSGNITRMAKALGIGRNTLYAKLRKYEIG